MSTLASIAREFPLVGGRVAVLSTDSASAMSQLVTDSGMLGRGASIIVGTADSAFRDTIRVTATPTILCADEHGTIVDVAEGALTRYELTKMFEARGLLPTPMTRLRNAIRPVHKTA
jgi:hypothetical protein